MVFGLDIFCRMCGCVISRGKEQCKECANSNGSPKKGSRFAFPLFLVMAALLSLTYASATWEQAKYNACNMGLACDVDSVVQQVYDNMNAIPTYTYPKNTVETFKEYTIVLNSTHELVVKQGYNITRSTVPVEAPTAPIGTSSAGCTCEDLIKRIEILEARIAALEAKGG